jgi:glycerophosphoryl diester phosphodiesterase
VLDLIDCYDDRDVTINLETKLDPTAPNETLAVEKYITDLVPILERRGYANRATMQSFDWRTLLGIRDMFPYMPLVALLDEVTLEKIDGAFPWLGGIDLDGDFQGDWVAAAASVGASVLSPAHGFPANESVEWPGYIPLVTEDVVKRGHDLGMAVVPWTADFDATIHKLINDGVDGIISNYPERVIWAANERGFSVGRGKIGSVPNCLAHANS